MDFPKDFLLYGLPREPSRCSPLWWFLEPNPYDYYNLKRKRIPEDFSKTNSKELVAIHGLKARADLNGHMAWLDLTGPGFWPEPWDDHRLCVYPIPKEKYVNFMDLLDKSKVLGEHENFFQASRALYTETQGIRIKPRNLRFIFMHRFIEDFDVPSRLCRDLEEEPPGGHPNHSC